MLFYCITSCYLDNLFQILVFFCWRSTLLVGIIKKWEILLAFFFSPPSENYPLSHYVLPSLSPVIFFSSKTVNTFLLASHISVFVSLLNTSANLDESKSVTYLFRFDQMICLSSRQLQGSSRLVPVLAVTVPKMIDGWDSILPGNSLAL